VKDMDGFIEKVISQDLSGANMNTLASKFAHVILFQDLAKFSTLKSAFMGKQALIMLFPVQSASVGHWICCLRYPTSYHHFDPYGFNTHEEFDHSKVQCENYLLNLYNHADMPVTYNTVRYQELEDGVNTCGRHTCVRSRMHHVPPEQYQKLMTGQKQSPDFIVTMLTILPLDEDETDSSLL
jgi:hypothetical protein